jgi:hypothetical protein
LSVSVGLGGVGSRPGNELNGLVTGLLDRKDSREEMSNASTDCEKGHFNTGLDEHGDICTAQQPIVLTLIRHFFSLTKKMQFSEILMRVRRKICGL